MGADIVLHPDSDNNHGGGFTTIPNIVFRNPTISPGAKIVFALCLRYERVLIFDIRRQLVADIGESIDQIAHYLSELSESGLLTVSSKLSGEEVISITI